MEVGVDEAGVGPAFGSLWAAAVHLPVPIEGLRDSKKLSAARRARLREAIVASAHYGMGEVTHEEIDRFGLGEARRLVFERALDALHEAHGMPERIVVDGTLFRPWRGVPYECMVGADDRVASVAASSILAKTARDAQVLGWCDEDPTLDERYKIRGNKGYLSAAHIEGLRVHGWSARHRKSYRVKGIK